MDTDLDGVNVLVTSLLIGVFAYRVIFSIFNPKGGSFGGRSERASETVGNYLSGKGP